MPDETVAQQPSTAIYTRQSRTSPGEFSSCEAQWAACMCFVTAHHGNGWVWNGKRYDDEGESGETLDRPGLQRLLADVRAGEIDRIVVHRLDRLSRRVVDCLPLLEELKNRRIPLSIVTQPDLECTAEHTFLLNIMASFAEFEHEMIRSRLAAARAAHKRRGRRVAGVVPYGYTADPRTKQLVVVPDEASRVQKIFRMALEGVIPREIAKTANESGWRTKQRISKSGEVTEGGLWTPQQILATLANPVYAGLIRDGAAARRGAHEAIVFEELFNQVATQVASRRTRPPGRSRSTIFRPLRGLLKCGQCGRLMSPSISGCRNLRYHFYRCRSYAGGRPPCNGVSVPAGEIERLVLEVVGNPDSQAVTGACQLAEDLCQAFAEAWSSFDDGKHRKLLPTLVEEVIYDARHSRISIRLDPEALRRLAYGETTDAPADG